MRSVIIYDCKTSNKDKKCYFIDKEGKKYYFPFYDIKLEEEFENIRIKRFPRQKIRNDHYKKLMKK